jgi:hypothetical protein
MGFYPNCGSDCKRWYPHIHRYENSLSTSDPRSKIKESTLFLENKRNISRICYCLLASLGKVVRCVLRHTRKVVGC